MLLSIRKDAANQTKPKLVQCQFAFAGCADRRSIGPAYFMTSDFAEDDNFYLCDKFATPACIGAFRDDRTGMKERASGGAGRFGTVLQWMRLAG